MSSVTRANHGRYNIFTSDATTTSTVIDQLAEALNDYGIAGNKVVYFEPATNKVAVVEQGR